MLFYSKLFVLIVLTATFAGLVVGSVVFGRSQTEMTSCISECTNKSIAKHDCREPTFMKCVCTNKGFQKDTKECIKQNCPKEDIDKAKELEKSNCKSFNPQHN